MLARFELADAVDVFKDPGGHYHHWTVLMGRIVEGTLRIGDVLIVPAADGGVIAARIGGFHAFLAAVSDTISADRHRTTRLGVMIHSPPILKELLPEPLAGVVVTQGTAEDLETTLSTSLEPARRPLLLHAVVMADEERAALGLDEADGPVICRPCLAMLGLRPDLVRRLPEVLDDPRPAVAAAAALALAEYRRQP